MLAEAVVIEGDAGGGGAEGGVGFDASLRPGKAQGELGRAPAGELIEVPDIAAGVILQTVAQQHRHNVLSRLQGQVVDIVIEDMIRIADVRGESALGIADTVDIQLIKAAGSDDHLACSRFRYLKGLPEAGGRNVVLKGIIRGSATDEISGIFHGAASFPVGFLHYIGPGASTQELFPKKKSWPKREQGQP